ncbi:hypothetical protein PRIPAC_80017, partial [Pristionchus pacificus]|uniref:Metalloendopeptidase n=1 Tax=Pristionchus pacificus TaxID=54126 RepID=A0A2A6BHY9_PRIPA
ILDLRMTTETSEQQRIKAIQAADNADDVQSIHKTCDELRLEQILSLSTSVVGSVSTKTMTTLLEASEKSLDRLMLGERKVYIELKERPGVPKTAWYQMTIRLSKSFDLWRQLPSNYKYLKFLNKVRKMKALILLLVSLFLFVKGSEESNDFVQVSSSESSSPNDSKLLQTRDRRAVLYAGTALWPKNETIYYGYDEKTASEFNSPIAQVLFRRHTDCLVLGVGWPGRNKTKIIYLTSRCDYSGVQHEFLHLLGLDHTVKRGDRDLYVTVKNNSAPAQFKKVNPGEELILTPPVGYDFKSIMHYRAWDYGFNDSITILPNEKQYVATMGWYLNPVFSDYKQLNMLYKCGDHCAYYATLKCENGGYHHPKECGKCVCHEFAYGNRCEKLHIKKLSEDYSEPPIFVTNNEKSILVNSTIRSDYVQIQPLAFMAPKGKQLNVTIEELVAPEGVMTDEYCVTQCGYRGFEFIDNKDGDLTMGGKLFCCSNWNGKSFITHSNILGYTGYVYKGYTASFKFRVEVYDKRSNATHPAPAPEWKFPDGQIADNEPDVCEIA